MTGPDPNDTSIADALKAERARVRDLERALELEREVLASLRRALGGLGSIMSHDLRSPTRHINVFSDLIKRESSLGQDESVSHIERIHGAAMRLFALIDALSEYTLSLSSEARLAPLELQASLDDALTLLRPGLESASVDMAVDPLPLVMADQALMSLVFQEVLSNAITYGVADPHRVEIQGQSQGDRAIIYIRDFGPGLPPEMHERAFDVLSAARIEPSRLASRGLAICRALIEIQHGSIWIEPSNTGLCVAISLQLHRE